MASPLGKNKHNGMWYKSYSDFHKKLKSKCKSNDMSANDVNIKYYQYQGFQAALEKEKESNLKVAKWIADQPQCRHDLCKRKFGIN